MRKRWLILFQRFDPVVFHEAFVIILVCLLAEPSLTALAVGAAVSFAGEALRLWVASFETPRGRFAIYGPYRYVRHPYQLGTFFLLLGACIAGRSTVATTVMLGGTLFIFRRIFHEEEALAAKLGGTRYKDYKMQVSSFLPNLVGYPPFGHEDLHFSIVEGFRRRHRRELDTVIGLVVGYVALYALREMPYSPVIQGIIALVLVIIFSAQYWFRTSKKAQAELT